MVCCGENFSRDSTASTGIFLMPDLAVCIGIGHIGIHLMHRKEIMSVDRSEE